MHDGLPRWADAALAFAGLVATLPLLVLASLAVRLTSPGPALFRQTRLGRGGRPFTLLKLRSMRTSPPGAAGTTVTVRGDVRITPIGRLLRRTKVDELPQLWNVLRGDLTLVGPRPEVPDHVDQGDPAWQRALSVRPGLTDPVTLRLRNEETLLAELAAETGKETERLYRHCVQPWKLRGYIAYLETRSAGSDLRCLLATVFAPLGFSFGFRTEPPTITELQVTEPQSPSHSHRTVRLSE